MSNDYNPDEFPLKEVSICSGEDVAVELAEPVVRTYEVTFTNSHLSDFVTAEHWRAEAWFAKFYLNGVAIVSFPISSIAAIKVVR